MFRQKLIRNRRLHNSEEPVYKNSESTVAVNDMSVTGTENNSVFVEGVNIRHPHFREEPVHFNIINKHLV